MRAIYEFGLHGLHAFLLVNLMPATGLYNSALASPA
jgi:uncharacterized membrane protein